jgi:hypothetical protein
MAYPKIIRGTYLNILLGNGAGPEVFAPICGARTKSITETTETTDDYTRDCAVPDSVPSRNITATGQRWDLAFSGVLNRTQLTDLRTARGVIKNWRFEVLQPVGDVVVGAGGYYAGAGMLTVLTITGDDGAGNATIEGSIASNGPWVWTTVP